MSLLDKIIFLSHPQFHAKNIQDLINILLKNCYPSEFIFCIINNKIKQLSHKNLMECPNENMDITTKKKAFLRFHMSRISQRSLRVYQKNMVYPSPSIIHSKNI